MASNYHYPAYTYMEEWLRVDREAQRVLGLENILPVDREMACKKLVEFATHYSIIRNFPVEQTGTRLGEAWDNLMLIEKPSTAAGAKNCVTELAGRLGSKKNLERVS